METKKDSALWKVLAVLALCLAVFNTVLLIRNQREAADIQYVLYLGTNDKDTNEPVFAPEEAMRQAEAIQSREYHG